MKISGQGKKPHKLFSRFFGNNSGQVAVIFAYAFLPMLGFVGAAVDYSRGEAALAQLNAAADAAALSAVSRAKLSAQHNVPSDSDLRTFFDAATGTATGVTVSSFTVTPTAAITSISVHIAYTATVSTTFMRALGVNTMTLSGNATAQAAYPPYVDFHLLLDNSPSMGLAATTAEQARMLGGTSYLNRGSCEFACHEYANGVGGAEKTNDYYLTAKAMNPPIQLRIDELKSGVANLISSAQSSQTLSNQYRFAIHTFSNTLVTVAGLSSNYTAQAAAANSIDMVFSDNNGQWQTDYGTVLPAMNVLIGAPGTGTVSSAPQKYLFFVTDGALDQGSGSTGTYGTVNTTLCSAIKTRGIKIAVLYTTYLPVTSGSLYPLYMSSISPYNTGSPTSITTALQSCASPGLFMATGPSVNIQSALQALFNDALAQSRLTQ